MPRRLASGGFIASLLWMAAAGPAAAASPPGGPDDGWGAVINPRPATAEQRASIERRLTYVAALEQRDRARTGSAPTASTPVYGMLATTPRAQETSTWCGPASIQVISDYAYGRYKVHSQRDIAARAGTGTDGTGITGERTALQWEIDRSPRAGFWYATVHPGDGATWSHYVQADIIYETMPLIFNLTPWAYDRQYGYWRWLVNWGSAKSTGGHYVVGSGVDGDWDGTTGPKVRYDDSATFSGGTGSYWDRQYDVYFLIHGHHDHVIW